MDKLELRKGEVLKDPWARFEAWRHQPHFNSRRNLLRFFPGFFWGVGAFFVAITIEKVFFEDKSKDDAHH